MRPIILALATLIALLAGCTEETPPASTTGAKCSVPAKSTLDLENASNPVAVWETTKGCFAAEMYLEQMPITAGNFVNLTNKDFYDGTRFHRVIEGFMVQDGDPNSKDTGKQGSWGQGGPGYSIKDEFACKDGTFSYTHPANCSAHGGLLHTHTRTGVISMANSGASSGGSQYFITITPGPGGFPTHLDGKHPIFGHVVWNQNIVEAIGRVPTDSRDRPLDSIVITTLTLVE